MTNMASMFLSPEAKKNLIQRRKKEKLPVDIVPSNEETLHRGEQTVAMEMDVTNTKTAEPETNVSPPADAVSSTQGVCVSVSVSV